MSFEERLITLVKENDFLYNTKSKTYKNVMKRNLVWEQIGKDLNKPVADCKQRWKSLRDRFVREKKSRELPSGSAAVFENEWEYYSALEFQIPSLATRRQYGNFGDTSVGASGSTQDLSSPRTPPEVFDFQHDDIVVSPKKRHSVKRKTDMAFHTFVGELNDAVNTQLAASVPTLDVDEEFMLNMAKRMKPAIRGS